MKAKKETQQTIPTKFEIVIGQILLLGISIFAGNFTLAKLDGYVPPNNGDLFDLFGYLSIALAIIYFFEVKKLRAKRSEMLFRASINNQYSKKFGN